MREITIALAQMQPKLGAVEENLAKIVQWIEKICVEQETDLIIFPELATTGYECGMNFSDFAHRIPGHATNYIAERAAHYSTHVLFGTVEAAKPDSVVYDTAVLIGPDGEIIHKYQKIHLKGEERLAFRPGYRYTVADTGLGTIGVLIGWDLAFPEGARSLALQGAELICVCANWEKPHRNEWRIYNQSRALENTAYVASANRMGDEYSYSFLGDSMVVGPRGEIHAMMEPVLTTTETEDGKTQEVEKEVEGYAVVNIDLDQVRQYRDDFQLLQARQPRSYREVVKMY